ncbi:MAG: site-specific DNA-methyltransferase, partial [Candidatus Coatesbacteria bacterium]
EKKKGADRGIDGRLYFHDEAKGGKTKQIVFSVKSGHVTSYMVRDLRGVVEREGAEIGVFITMLNPTKDMRSEAAGAGFYESATWQKRYPRIQILTIEDILRGRGIDCPPLKRTNVTFKKAPKARNNDINDSNKLFD